MSTDVNEALRGVNGLYGEKGVFFLFAVDSSVGVHTADTKASGMAEGERYKCL